MTPRRSLKGRAKAGSSNSALVAGSSANEGAIAAALAVAGTA